jgi:hypothetical protein
MVSAKASILKGDNTNAFDSSQYAGISCNAPSENCSERLLLGTILPNQPGREQL